jgi:hypothetical protein
VQRFNEYLFLNGCCSSMEEDALIHFWKTVRHPSYKSFQLTWQDGHQEIFHEPQFSCHPTTFPEKTVAPDGEKLLSRCVMNDLCGRSARNFFEPDNFPTSCCTGDLAPTCCSLLSPLTGNLSVCDHGKQHRPGDCWCACELGWVGRTCDRNDIHMVFDIVFDSISVGQFLAAKRQLIRRVFAKFFTSLEQHIVSRCALACDPAARLIG